MCLCVLLWPCKMLVKSKRGDDDYCHTLILDLKILTQIPLLFSNTFRFTVFSTVLQLHTLLFQSFNFGIKSYKRVFWSFPTKEPIFSPYNLSLSLVNLFA